MKAIIVTIKEMPHEHKIDTRIYLRAKSNNQWETANQKNTKKCSLDCLKIVYERD